MVSMGVADPTLGISMLWLPTGISTGLIWRWGWPAVAGVLVAAVGMDAWSEPNAGAWRGLLAGAQALGGLGMVLLLRRWGFRAALSGRFDLVKLLVAGLAGMFVCAVGGVSALALAGVIPVALVYSSILSWWAGDMLGILVVLPFLLAWAPENLEGIGQRPVAFGVWWLLLAAGCASFAWVTPSWPAAGLPVAFALVPLGLWASFQFGALASALVPVALTLAGAVAVSSEVGLFLGRSGPMNVFLLWSYATLLSAVHLVTTVLQQERRVVERALEQTQEMLTGIWRAQSRFIHQAPLPAVFGELLSTVLDVTGARMGFIGSFEVDAVTGSRYLHIHSMDTRSSDPAERAFVARGRGGALEVRNMEGIFGGIVREGQTVRLDTLDPALHLRDVPAGHPWLHNFLGLPFFQGPTATGMIALANHPERFSPALDGLLEPVLATCAGLVDAWRLREQRDHADARVRELAYYDPLTGLPNRRMLLQQLDALQDSPRPEAWAACLFVDLDDFKLINDTGGHERGDLALQAIARRLRAWQPPQATVARLGGDEFVVLLTSLPSEADGARDQALVAAHRAREVIAAPLELEGNEHQIRASVGVYVFPAGESHGPVLLRNADAAMYAAKEAGRNTVCVFDAAVQAVVERAARVQLDLRAAIQQGALRFDQQPIVDRALRPVAVELLARWDHPQLGEISPEEFIPLAERSGLIRPLGEAALAHAMALLKAWARQGNPLEVSVNVSPGQLTDAGFVDAVEAMVRRAGIDPVRLTLEVTESQLLVPGSPAVRALHRLSGLGIRIVVDDFGTGYASFNYLQHLPLHGFKLARTFLHGADDRTPGRPLARSMVELAHSLDLKVTAEGIESAEHFAAMKAVGCDTFQGFWLGRPQPSGEVGTPG
jgi:diguanylate cyclase (GGDEF)-like protein